MATKFSNNDVTGLYQIEDIHDNQIITISGIVRVEIPSASEAVQADVTSVWTSAGCIHLHVAVESMVIITDVNGRVVVRQQVAAGDHRFALPQGAYVVTVDSIVEKIMLR